MINIIIAKIIIITGKIKKTTKVPAMVDNPIYDGRVYESIHTQLDTLGSPTVQITDGFDNNDEPYNTAPTYSSKEAALEECDRSTILYNVDLPRSKSLVFKNLSVLSDDASNISRTTSVSVPFIKMSGKQQNKHKSTIDLTGDDLVGLDNTETKGAALSSDLVSSVNSTVHADMNENYVIMRPAGAITSVRRLGELYPKDTDIKYIHKE